MSRSQRKRKIVSAIMASLLVASSVFVYGSGNSEVKGAAYRTVTNVEQDLYRLSSDSFGTDNYYARTKISLSDGSQYVINRDGTGGFAKYEPGETSLSSGGYNSPDSYPFLGADGYLYKGKYYGTEKIVTDKKFVKAVAAFEAPKPLYPGSSTFFAIGEDGLTYAWGSGTQGQLGIGSKVDRSVPAEVVDPATDDPILGVKNIIQAPEQGVILLTEGNKAYLVGKGFGLSSLDTAKPLLLTDFPAFSSPNNVSVSYLGKTSPVGYKYSIQRNNGGSWEDYIFRRYILTIDGNNYVLNSLNDKVTSDQSGSITGLIPINLDPSKVQIYPETGNYSHEYTGIYLDNGDLYTWDTSGVRMSQWSDTPAATVEGKVKIDSGVTKAFFNNRVNTYWYLKGTKLYAVGENGYNQAGVTGMLKTPVRIRGPKDEMLNVKDIAQFQEPNMGAPFFLFIDTNGNLFREHMSNVYPVSGGPYTGFIEMPTSGLNGAREVYVVGEDGKLYYLKYISSNVAPQLVSGVDNIASPGSVPPVSLPTPTHSTTIADDPYENTTVTLNFGSDPKATVHEYSLDSGATWLSYTAPFKLTQTGNVNVWARNGDGSGNYSSLDKFSVTNNPIPQIGAEYPKISFNKDANSGKTFTSLESGTTDSRVKMEISQDGITWNSYSTPVELSIGSHTIYARLLNSNQVEIVRKQQNYNVVDDTTPTAPVINQGSLDDNFKLPLTFTYDGTKGTLKYRIGGTWIDYTSGVVKVDNKQAIVDAKVVSSSGKESPVTSYTVSPVLPTVTSSNGTISIDINNFPNNTDLSIQYMDDVSATWTPYTGVITGLPDGDHTITVKLINSKTGAEFTESTVVNVNGNGSSGGGGTAPTAPPAGWGSPVGTEDVKLNVLSGGLTSTFQGVKLDNIVISTTDPYQQLNSVTNATIEDSRGTGKGWSYTLGVTDFVNDKAFDSSTGNNDLVVKMPSSVLSVQVAKSQTLAGQDGNLSFPGNYVFGDKPITVAKAEAMQGMGQYNLGMDFTLRVPDKVEVVSTGSGSGYKSGEKTGLRVGTYRSVFTFTLTSGI